MQELLTIRLYDHLQQRPPKKGDLFQQDFQIGNPKNWDYDPKQPGR